MALLRAHWPLIAITVAAGVVRLATLDLQSYWYDEVSTVAVLEEPSFGAMLGEIPSSESNPPLYYVLAWIWTQVFGTGEVGLRSLSALAGTATVPVVYWAGARLVSQRVGLLAAALIAFQPILIWFSQEARNYALLVLLGALSIALLIESLKTPDWRRLGGWALVSSLAIATHYFAAFLIAGEAIALLALCRDPGRAIRATAIVVVVAAALVPLAIEQAGEPKNDWIAELDLLSRLAYARLIAVAGDATAPLIVVPTALILGAIALAVRGDPEERAGSYLGAWLFGAAVLPPLALAVLGPDYFLARNVLPALVPMALVVAIGFGSRRAGWLGVAAVGAMCVYLLTVAAERNLNELRQRKDWRGAAAAVGEATEPRLIVVETLGGRPFDYYLPSVSAAEEPIKVREVIVVRDASGDPSQPQLPAGFQRGRRETAGQFHVTTFRARRPTTLDLERLCCEGGGREVLSQAPIRSARRPSPAG